MATRETLRKKKYEPVSKLSRGVKLEREDKKAIIDKVQDTFLRCGYINKSKLSRDLKISRPTMISIINEMKIEMESIPAIKIELKLIFERIKNRLMYLWDKLIEIGEIQGKLNIKDELAIMREIKDTIDNFYKLLQEFGEAPKPTENVNIQGNIMHKQIIVNIPVEVTQLLKNGNTENRV